MSRRPNCINVEWVGRADCAHCGVRHLMLFSTLPESAFEDILYPIDNMKYSRGSTLYKESDNDDGVYSVRRGLIKLLHLAADGTQRIVRLLGPGSVIGLE